MRGELVCLYQSDSWIRVPIVYSTSLWSGRLPRALDPVPVCTFPSISIYPHWYLMLTSCVKGKASNTIKLQFHFYGRRSANISNYRSSTVFLSDSRDKWPGHLYHCVEPLHRFCLMIIVFFPPKEAHCNPDKKNKRALPDNFITLNCIKL